MNLKLDRTDLNHRFGGARETGWFDMFSRKQLFTAPSGHSRYLLRLVAVRRLETLS